MKSLDALLLLSTLSSSALAAESARPRGVGPEFAKFYKSPSTFTCISNPSVTLLPSQINDDYCDCPDGSDEPGTAACTHLSPLSPPQPIGGVGPGANTTLALPGFYCKNKGHIPGYIPHMYVNDGACDHDVCCDGSDEYDGVGGVKCEDRCKEIGKEWRRMDEIKQKARREAGKKKEALVKEAMALREGVEASIRRLGGEIDAQERKVQELKTKFEEVERRERGRVVLGTAEGTGSKVTVLAGLAKKRVEELREALLEQMKEKERAKAQLGDLEAILRTFKEEYNPNFNDEGVKRAVKAWEEYAASAVQEAIDEDKEKDLLEIMKPDSETEGINWAEWEVEQESDVDALYKFEEYLPGPVRDWVHRKLSDLRAMLVENGILADNSKPGSESKAVADARTAHQSAEDELRNKRTSRDDLTADLTKEYGPDDVFRALKGACVSKDSGEYEYELCWLDKTTQKSKKGGGHTGLGNFVRIDKMEVDEEVGADGKGVGAGVRTVLMYENGQQCWNGPARQTTVVLACAAKDEVWKVVEQEKCMYRMDVGTPAVCDSEVGSRADTSGKGNGKAKSKGKGKEEL